MIKRARKSPCRCFIASRQVIPMVIVIHIVPGALYFFLFTMMWTLWGPGSRLLFWLGRLPTVQACRLFACPATRRPVHIKPWQKLVNQHHNAHHCNPSTVCRGFGPHAAHGRRGRFNCRAVPAAALASILMHNGPAPPMLVLPLCFQTNHYKYLSGLCLCMCFPGTFPLLYLL